MDVRVLGEALLSTEPPDENSSPAPVTKTIKATASLGFLSWHQYLTFTRFGSATYYEAGNGECRLKPIENDSAPALRTSRTAVKAVKISALEASLTP